MRMCPLGMLLSIMGVWLFRVNISAAAVADVFVFSSPSRRGPLQWLFTAIILPPRCTRRPHRQYCTTWFRRGAFVAIALYYKYIINIYILRMYIWNILYITLCSFIYIARVQWFQQKQTAVDAEALVHYYTSPYLFAVWGACLKTIRVICILYYSTIIIYCNA